MDRPVHAIDRTYHRFAVVLPETGEEGGQIFTSRLADKLAEYLSGKGITVKREEITSQSITFPGQEDALTQLRTAYTEIAKTEHPEVEDASATKQTS